MLLGEGVGRVSCYSGVETKETEAQGNDGCDASKEFLAEVLGF